MSSYNSPSSLSSALANLAPSTPETPSSVTVLAVACARVAKPATTRSATHLLIDDIEPRFDVGAVARRQEREVHVAEMEVVDLGLDLERAMHPRQAPRDLEAGDVGPEGRQLAIRGDERLQRRRRVVRAKEAGARLIIEALAQAQRHVFPRDEVA